MLTTGPPGKTRGCVFKPNSGTLSVLGSDGKEFTCSVGDPGSIPGLGRCLGGGHGNPLQVFLLENPYGQRSLAGYSPQGHKELDMSVQLSTAQHKIRHALGAVSEL